MEVFVSSPGRSKFSNCLFTEGSVVRDLLLRFVQQLEASPHDLYFSKDGRLACLDDHLQGGAVYHLQARVLGGKGGFGSMLRALGAQIEKTTNREACRDLSGRRLRDVNHENEMADWLKKQTEREAEKEQRRLERLQRKLLEPKHQFSDASYEQQCHDLSERLEDSVLKGLQAASSPEVSAQLSPKRKASIQSEPPIKKQKKMGACFWSGFDELTSSEDEDDSPSTSTCEVAATMKTQWAEPGPSCSFVATPPQEVVKAQMAMPPKEEARAHKASPPKEEATAHEAMPPKKEASLHEATPPKEKAQALKTTPPKKEPEVKASTPEEEAEAQKATPPKEEAEAQKATLPIEEAEAQKASPHVEEAEAQKATPPKEEAEAQKATPTQVEAEAQKASSCSPEPQPGEDADGGAVTVSVSSATCVQQLEHLGLEVLKQELMRRGVKCGGTLSERAARLFVVRNLQLDQIDPTLLAKPAKSKRK
ncbi:splicing regulator SDE2 [Nerophis ophidion]|uniref:splicing regulator SDE2 n=1 Tax=Nerophis ophidion TaxID=159077 RepID=UPI002AE02DE7|nr:splicing regulator SDE2 [Nerophis ophidion]